MHGIVVVYSVLFRNSATVVKCLKNASSEVFGNNSEVYDAFQEAWQSRCAFCEPAQTKSTEVEQPKLTRRQIVIWTTIPSVDSPPMKGTSSSSYTSLRERQNS